MPKYRKKPVVIDAFKLTSPSTFPDWFLEAIKSGIVVDHSTQSLRIKTLEGDMTANDGDYIIKGVKGEIYPCKPDIFETTYEEVTE